MHFSYVLLAPSVLPVACLPVFVTLPEPCFPLMSLAKKKSWAPLWPLSTSPPLTDETLQERRARQAEAALAKARSDHIDSVIETERKQRQKCDGPKVLLLGMYLCFIRPYTNPGRLDKY